MQITITGIQRTESTAFRKIERSVASFRMFFEQVAKPLLIEEVEAIFAEGGHSTPLASVSTLHSRRETQAWVG